VPASLPPLPPVGSGHIHPARVTMWLSIKGVLLVLALVAALGSTGSDGRVWRPSSLGGVSPLLVRHVRSPGPDPGSEEGGSDPGEEEAAAPIAASGSGSAESGSFSEEDSVEDDGSDAGDLTGSEESETGVGEAGGGDGGGGEGGEDLSDATAGRAFHGQGRGFFGDLLGTVTGAASSAYHAVKCLFGCSGDGADYPASGESTGSGEAGDGGTVFEGPDPKPADGGDEEHHEEAAAAEEAAAPPPADDAAAEEKPAEDAAAADPPAEEPAAE